MFLKPFLKEYSYFYMSVFFHNIDATFLLQLKWSLISFGLLTFLVLKKCGPPKILIPKKFGPRIKIIIWQFLHQISWVPNFSGPKFLGVQISQGPNFLGSKFLRAQISWGPKKSQGPKYEIEDHFSYSLHFWYIFADSLLP